MRHGDLLTFGGPGTQEHPNDTQFCLHYPPEPALPTPSGPAQSTPPKLPAAASITPSVPLQPQLEKVIQPKMHRAVPAVRCATAPPVLWRGSCGPSQGQLLSGGEYASIIPEVGRGGEAVVDAQTGRTGATAAGRFANAHGITEGASLGAVSRVCKADAASRLSAVEAGAPAAAAQTKAETDDDQRVVTSGLAAVASTMPEDAAAAAGGGGNTPARGETGRILSVGVIIDLTEDDDALAGAPALPVVHSDLACSKVSQVGARRVRAEGESADGDDAARSPAKRACGAAVAPPGGTGAVGETGEGVAKAKAEAEAEPTGGGPRLTELLPAEADSQDARAVMVRNTRTHAHARTRTHLRTHAYVCTCVRLFALVFMIIFLRVWLILCVRVCCWIMCSCASSFCSYA